MGTIQKVKASYWVTTGFLKPLVIILSNFKIKGNKKAFKWAEQQDGERVTTFRTPR